MASEFPSSSVFGQFDGLLHHCVVATRRQHFSPLLCSGFALDHVVDDSANERLRSSSRVAAKAVSNSATAAAREIV
jgi:hypothetical protein